MYKRFFKISLSLTLTLLVMIGTVVFFIDPFNHYRADKDLTKIIHHQTYYQNVGIAKNASYDTLITGSSMVQNFRADHFDQKTGSKAIRLPFEGGILSDYITLIDTAIENNNDLKCIYFGLDNYLITGDSNLLNETERIPSYFVDNNIFTDVKYLLNKDVIFTYMRTYFGNKTRSDYNIYEMQMWENSNTVFSKEAVLDGYKKQEQAATQPIDLYEDSALNVSKTLCERIANNPDITFIFFAPPYSILQWYSTVTAGKLDSNIFALKTIYGKLLKYNNVRLFYFQNIPELITNLDNYKDATHYRSSYNEYMLECFANGNYELTTKNYIQALDDMKNYAENYNYNSIFE